MARTGRPIIDQAKPFLLSARVSSALRDQFVLIADERGVDTSHLVREALSDYPRQYIVQQSRISHIQIQIPPAYIKRIAEQTGKEEEETDALFVAFVTGRIRKTFPYASITLISLVEDDTTRIELLTDCSPFVRAAFDDAARKIIQDTLDTQWWNEEPEIKPQPIVVE